MNTKIDAEFWNTLTRVQKRAVAENLAVAPVAANGDVSEFAAWASTLAVAAAVVVFTLILVR
jgi:hypothetical protein